ncbi:MAG TPA: hypothetical protein VMU43_14035 [Candidatus Acidoferrum sp.]|nr:hypothetical protein [Candidatus Acidoferrum sp.]
MAHDLSVEKLLVRSETPASEAEQAIAYCPRCSERLEPRKCKMICAACGYYMSCSDFY